MERKSVMSSLGLKKSPVVRRVPYVLPEIFDSENWEQVIKLLFVENSKNGILMEFGYIDLDVAFSQSKNEDIIQAKEALGENKTPFCGRKAYLGQIELTENVLRDRKEDEKHEGMETTMLYIVTFKNMEYPPRDLKELINQAIVEKRKPLTALEKKKIINDYIEDPEKFLPTLPVYIKATTEIFDVMYGASLQIVNDLVDETGTKIYDPTWKSFRISNDNLVVVLVGGRIWGKNSKSCWIDQAVYFTEGDL